MCNCTCPCDDHRTCDCRGDWCFCLIETKSRKRKRCPCKGLMQTDMMISLSGYFIGDFCPRCGLFSRTTEFYQERHNAAKLFKDIEEEQAEVTKMVTGAMAFIDYNNMAYCANCVKIEYHNDVVWAAKSGLLKPLHKDDELPNCSVCGKISQDIYISS